MSHQYSWANHQQQKHVGNEFMFVHEDHHHNHRESDTAGIPILSWRLNVPERSSLVHDYTC